MSDGYRTKSLPPLDDVSRDDLQDTLEGLVKENPDLAKEVNAKLEQIRRTTEERLKAAGKETQLSPEDKYFLQTLQSHFEKNPRICEGIQWIDVEKALKAHPEKISPLRQLETTGGFPDVIGEDQDVFIFGDCSAPSPNRRRNLVFDAEAQKHPEERLEEKYYVYEEDEIDYKTALHPVNIFGNFMNFSGGGGIVVPVRTKRYRRKKIIRLLPAGNVVGVAANMGADLMDEQQYRALQKKIAMDRDTRSWLKTPPDVRQSGYALCGQRKGDVVNVVPVAASEFRPGRGFRAVVSIPKVK